MGEGLSLESVAQMAITLAGFSGLVAMIRSGPVYSWHPRVRMTFWLTLAWSLAATFFSALPSILSPFGIIGWALPCALVAAFLLLAVVVMLYAHVRMTRQGYPTQNSALWVPTILVPLLGAGCAIGGVAGWSGAQSGYDWYRVAVLACLFEVFFPFLASFRVRAGESPA
jgi:lysylphosphatidylglycerol synthetase-like protein (DUF2156 family)